MNIRGLQIETGTETAPRPMRRRAHPLPFGAEVEPGGVRFRLWAPGAREVAVEIDGAAPLALSPSDDGMFELRTDRARAGSRYRYVLDGADVVPDPASRFQPDDVHGASEVVDPRAHAWPAHLWNGRPWHEMAFYELHLGTFTPEGTYASAAARLDDLVALGVTAIELMPLSDQPGSRNWGYDGVFPFAPDARYGRPEELKAFVALAHEKGLAVFLDVVYNHFGPEGNYLHRLSPQFFTDRRHTPWGSAIAYDDERGAVVREFAIGNALFWLEEYDFDGLRLDAVQEIYDDSSRHVLNELADRVHALPGRTRFLVLENDANQARYLERYDAQWNDDAHHCLHVLLTGEIDGYYADYAHDPIARLGRVLTEGYAYQGDPSAYRDGAIRGEPSADYPVLKFVNCLQNHDQIGNRAFGDRLSATVPFETLRAGVAVLLLAPSPPLLFMGEEWAASAPFQFFCDFEPELAKLVTEGRRREFTRFTAFSNPEARERIPDPSAVETFERSKLDWSERTREPHARTLALYRELLQVRARALAPRLAGMAPRGTTVRVLGDRTLQATWTLGDGSTLLLLANLGAAPCAGVPAPAGDPLYATGPETAAAIRAGTLAPWTVAWYLAR